MVRRTWLAGDAQGLLQWLALSRMVWDNGAVGGRSCWRAWQVGPQGPGWQVGHKGCCNEVQHWRDVDTGPI